MGKHFRRFMDRSNILCRLLLETRDVEHHPQHRRRHYLRRDGPGLVRDRLLSSTKNRYFITILTAFAVASSILWLISPTTGLDVRATNVVNLLFLSVTVLPIARVLDRRLWPAVLG